MFTLVACNLDNFPVRLLHWEAKIKLYEKQEKKKIKPTGQKSGFGWGLYYTKNRAWGT
jgi:hypothetical protein